MDRLSVASCAAIAALCAVVLVMVTTGEQAPARVRRTAGVERPTVSPERERAARALYAEGETLLQKGSIGEALSAFEAAKEQNPGSALIFLRLAVVLREHRPDQVAVIVHCLRRATDLDPDFAKPGSVKYIGKRYAVEAYVNGIAVRAFKGDAALLGNPDFMADLEALLSLFRAGCT